MRELKAKKAKFGFEEHLGPVVRAERDDLAEKVRALCDK
jgi:hypothetical protein